MVSQRVTTRPGVVQGCRQLPRKARCVERGRTKAHSMHRDSQGVPLAIIAMLQCCKNSRCLCFDMWGCGLSSAQGRAASGNYDATPRSHPRPPAWSLRYVATASWLGFWSAPACRYTDLSCASALASARARAEQSRQGNREAEILASPGARDLLARPGGPIRKPLRRFLAISQRHSWLGPQPAWEPTCVSQLMSGPSCP